jgi:hypothetical protein
LWWSFSCGVATAINNNYGPFPTNTAFSAYFNPPLPTSLFKKVIDPTTASTLLPRNCLAAFLNASTTPP